MEANRRIQAFIEIVNGVPCAETVGDIDILATADARSDVMERFVRSLEVKDVLSHGETRSSVVLASGIQADLRVVPRESYGAALLPHRFEGAQHRGQAARPGARPEAQRVRRVPRR